MGRLSLEGLDGPTAWWSHRAANAQLSDTDWTRIDCPDWADVAVVFNRSTATSSNLLYLNTTGKSTPATQGSATIDSAQQDNGEIAPGSFALVNLTSDANGTPRRLRAFSVWGQEGEDHPLEIRFYAESCAPKAAR